VSSETQGGTSLNLKQAAHRLSVHYQTAYRWVRDGQLAAVKIGNRYEVSEAAIEQFLSQRASLASVPLGSASETVPEAAATTGAALSEIRVLSRQTRMTAQPCFDAATVLAGSIVGDAAVLRLLDGAGRELLPVSSFAVSPEIRASVVGAVAAAGSFPRDTPHWSAAERSAEVHVAHHMPRDTMRELFGEEGRFVGRGVPVLAAAVAPMFVAGEYVGGLLAVKSVSYAPFSDEETDLLREAAELCAASHRRAAVFGRAWRSNAELNERVASQLAAGTDLAEIARDVRLRSSDLAHALIAPDGSMLESSSSFDDAVSAASSGSRPSAVLDGLLDDAQVRAVIEGISNMVDVEAVVPGGPGAIVSAVRGADVQLRVLVVDLIVS
jgi:excisionase family DNA binding protein